MFLRMSYVPVIGLEIHARIKTRTKLFCRCANEPVPTEANAHVCPICMGFPGMLPLLNAEAVRLALRASLALGMTITRDTKFDRKNYFYPDLPMGYQISQYDKPIGMHGSLIIEGADGMPRTIGIERLHMENDAGKLSHFDDGSYVDFNRAGAPLMEIVSMPELFSVEDARAYAEEMQQILRTVGSSDADMEKGMMRFDANISLRSGPDAPFGTKVEIKNLNSFRSLERALTYEIDRQQRLLDRGDAIVQETRGWDDGAGKTISQRTKEEAADYRYFPEPDLAPLALTDAMIEEERTKLPELPFAQRARYRSLGLDKDVARVLQQDEALGRLFEELSTLTKNPKASAMWLTSIVLAEVARTKEQVANIRFPITYLARLISLVAEDAISLLSAKETFVRMYATGEDPEKIIDALGFRQVSDDGALLAMIEETLAAFPTQLAEYRQGKTALLGFFVGQVMQRSKGSANPKKVQELLSQKLS